MMSEQNPPTEIPSSYTFINESLLKTFYLNDKEKTLIMVWKGGVDNDDMQYKDDSFHSIDLINKYKINFLVSDTRKSEFTISPDLQVWYAEEIVPQLEENGLKKCAIILNDDLNMLSALEEISSNVLRSQGVQKIPHRFFSTLTDAFKWLAG